MNESPTKTTVMKNTELKPAPLRLKLPVTEGLGEMKRSFFLAVVVSILLYGCTT